MDGQAQTIAGEGRRESPSLDVSGASALVVDDIPENRDLLVRRLKRLGIGDIEEAADGRQALDRLAERSFDLVLLDIMMPVMNGYEVLEVLRADGRTSETPVIVISALSETDAVARCIEEGAEDFIFKPFNPTILRARVLGSLEKKQLRDKTRDALARKQAELAEARSLQLALAPPPADRLAPCGRIRIDVLLEPAREVGGDLVDHFEVGEALQVVLLGDVSDKGAGAALVMARTSAMFRGLAVRPDAEALFASPERAAGVVNDALARGNPSCMFVTLLLASLDTRTGALAFVRCGHVPPFLRRADGRIERLEGAGGLPLGVMEGVGYRGAAAALGVGDQLLVVTDGVTEASEPGGALFGDEAVVAWLQAVGARAELGDLLARVRAYEAGAPPSDDLAALLLRIDAPAA